MSWYSGYTLLGLLENLEISGDRNLLDFRFPIQLVCRPQTDELHDFRGYQGRIESGSLQVGDEVVALPSGLSSKVERIVTLDGDLQTAFAPMSVTLTLAEDIDVSMAITTIHMKSNFLESISSRQRDSWKGLILLQ